MRRSALLLLLLTGCAGRQLRGNVDPGMTPADVKRLWGKPTKVETHVTAQGASELWIYCTAGAVTWTSWNADECRDQKRVTIVDGHVVDVVR
jgi:hypothetical protein